MKPQKESILQTMASSPTKILCDAGESDLCRDDAAAFLLKFVAIASILLAGAAGVAIPLIGKNRRFLQTEGNLFVAAKAFAAGVILATGFVHMLAGGTEALTNPCLPDYPWSKFPFPGFFAMVAALITLLVDFMGTQYYESKQQRNEVAGGGGGEAAVVEPGREETSSVLPVVVERGNDNSKVFGEEDAGGIHIVGIRAHAAHHRHSHSNGHGTCDGHAHGQSHGHVHVRGSHDVENGARHVVVSQVYISYSSFFTDSTTKATVCINRFIDFGRYWSLGLCRTQSS